MRYPFRSPQSSVQPGISFFASKVLLGKSGVEKIYPRMCPRYGYLAVAYKVLRTRFPILSCSARWPHAVRDGGGERHDPRAEVQH